MNCHCCADTGHVCENHPQRPWGGISTDPQACDCGAGMPCPVCCDEPAQDGTQSIVAAFNPVFRFAKRPA